MEAKLEEAEREKRALKLANDVAEVSAWASKLDGERAARASAAAVADAKERRARDQIARDKAEIVASAKACEEADGIAHLASIARAAILKHVEAETTELRKKLAAENRRVDGERAAVEEDLALREAALAAEQTKLSAALERLRFTRPREAAAAKQVKTLEDARDKAEKDRLDAEAREAAARASVTKNLAALRSLAAAVARATSEANDARVNAAEAEQQAAANAAAVHRSRAAAGEEKAREAAEKAARERIAAAKAEASRIIAARHTPGGTALPDSANSTPIAG